MILLMGRWDDGGNLVIEESTNVSHLSEAEIDAIVAAQDDSDGMAWAASFHVATHAEALDEARAEYLANDALDDGELIDKS